MRETPLVVSVEGLAPPHEVSAQGDHARPLADVQGVRTDPRPLYSLGSGVTAGNREIHLDSVCSFYLGQAPTDVRLFSLLGSGT